jgi:hypothetical protein
VGIGEGAEKYNNEKLHADKGPRDFNLNEEIG